MVDSRMVSVFLPQLLVVLLLRLALRLIHGVQTFPPLVLLRHLVFLELIVAFLVKVLQVFGRLQMKTKKVRRGKFTPGLYSL